MRRGKGANISLVILCDLIMLEKFLEKYEISEGDCLEVKTAKSMLDRIKASYYNRHPVDFNQVTNLILEFKSKYKQEIEVTDLEDGWKN